MNIFQNKKPCKGFTLAEALVLLLVSSLLVIATMPVITKKKRSRLEVKNTPPGGWVCLRSMMPCTFIPPAKASNFAIFFNDSYIPDFAAGNLGNITIKPAATDPKNKGCGGDPDLNRYLDDYKEGKAILKGTFCTDALLVRIVY